MHRTYDYAAAKNRAVYNQNIHTPSVTLTRDTSYLFSTGERNSHRRDNSRSYSNNLNYHHVDKDHNRICIDKPIPIKDYNETQRSKLPEISFKDCSTNLNETRKEMKLETEIKYKNKNIQRLEAENAELKKEVHRLRKIEAGWNLGVLKSSSNDKKDDIKMLVEQNNYLKAHIEECKEKLMEFERLIENLQAEKQNLETKYYDNYKSRSQEIYLKKQIETLQNKENAELEQLNDTLMRSEDEIKRLKEELTVCRNEMKRCEEDKERYRRERNCIRKETKSLEAELDYYRAEMKETEQELETEKLRRESSRPSIDYQLRSRELETELSKKDETIRELQLEVQHLRRNKADNTRSESEVAELKSQITNLVQENQFLCKKLEISENNKFEDTRAENSEVERIEELEKLIEMYKNRLSIKDDQINSYRKELEAYQNEIHKQKMGSEETDIKTKVGLTLEHKKDVQRLKAMRLKNEELASRVTHLELENKKLRDVLKQSNTPLEHSATLGKAIYSNVNSYNEIEDDGVKAVIKALESEELEKGKALYQSEVQKTLKQSLNGS